MPTELMTTLPYVTAGLAGSIAVGAAWVALGRRNASAPKTVAAKQPRSAEVAAARGASPKPPESAARSTDYVLYADHQSVVNALKSEIADLRSSVVAMEVRMHALKQRQDQQLDAMAAGRDIDERAASFTTEDLVALAKQGWSSQNIARVARLSAAEADLLTRLHGGSSSAAANSARHAS